MQVWNDGMLEAQVQSQQTKVMASEGIAVHSADPLARRALISALSFAGLADEVREDEGAGVILYDDGPVPPPGPLRVVSDAAGPAVAWLALVATAGRARQALGGGFRGALGRDASPEVLAAAIGALRQGLVAIDPRFASEVLPTPPAAVGVLALTPREHQVLELVAEGLSNKEIGAQLGVSPHTAKFHVTALLDKLGAETRTEAVVLAARSGLLDL